MFLADTYFHSFGNIICCLPVCKNRKDSLIIFMFLAPDTCSLDCDFSCKTFWKPGFTKGSWWGINITMWVKCLRGVAHWRSWRWPQAPSKISEGKFTAQWFTGHVLSWVRVNNITREQLVALTMFSTPDPEKLYLRVLAWHRFCGLGFFFGVCSPTFVMHVS